VSVTSLSDPSEIVIMPAPAAFLEFIDKNADAFIKRLAAAVAIPS